MVKFLIDNAAIISTIGFFIAFCLITFFVLQKRNKKKFEDYSNIPFNEKD